nr:MAG TPA: hypothetical protein [Caudoviricetes sp.]
MILAIIRIPPYEILCNKNNIKMINRVKEEKHISSLLQYYLFLS